MLLKNPSDPNLVKELRFDQSNYGAVVFETNTYEEPCSVHRLAEAEHSYGADESVLKMKKVMKPGLSRCNRENEGEVYE